MARGGAVGERVGEREGGAGGVRGGKGKGLAPIPKGISRIGDLPNRGSPEAAYGVLLESVHFHEELVKGHLHRLLLLWVAVRACGYAQKSGVGREQHGREQPPQRAARQRAARQAGPSLGEGRASSATITDRINLVDEDDAGRALLRRLVPYPHRTESSVGSLRWVVR